MTYGKIDSSRQIMTMPNPFRLVVANPTDSQKSLIAELDNWLELVYTEQPSYNPDTEYLTQYWQEEDGKAVQHWEIHEIEEPEMINESE